MTTKETHRLEKLLKRPPSKLSDIEKKLLEYNSQYNKAYCLKWYSEIRR